MKNKHLLDMSKSPIDPWLTFSPECKQPIPESRFKQISHQSTISLRSLIFLLSSHMCYLGNRNPTTLRQVTKPLFWETVRLTAAIGHWYWKYHVLGHLAGSVGWASDYSSGHDLMVCEFEPRVRLCADSPEPGACLGFCVSLSLCYSPACILSLCLSQK